MPRGTLVVGVGGAGRGVVNYLKRTLEQEYGSPANAGVVLYCIDGPVSDQYILPGGYQLDTSVDSNEFYQLRQSPVNPIKTIAGGGRFEFVEDWLFPEDAKKVPLAGIDPPAGMGGERVPGRVTLFLELNQLEPELNRVITLARTFLPRETRRAEGGEEVPGTRVNIFLVGSQSGGTGSGLLLDVAQLLHRRKARDRLIGIIVLPNSFSAVIKNPGDVRKRDAKAFTGIRELYRFQAASSALSTRIRYASAIDVSNDQLFDLCFLMDGQGEHLDLGDSFPLYGFVPSMADLILATIKDSRHIEPNVINWIQHYIAPAASSEKFSAYGVHTFIYPDRDLIETFAVRFAQELYNQLLTPPPAAADEGRDLGFGVLSGIKFGEMAVDLQKGKGIPAQPDEFESLRLSIAAGIGDAPFPYDPVLNLEEVVKTSGLFRPHTNATVMQDCQNEAARYLGKETDTAPQTVQGWIHYQSDRIARRFTDSLTRCITDIFYELRQNQLSPRRLDQKPYTIVVANDFLRTLLESLRGLKENLDAAYRSHSQRIVSGVQTDILTLQREEVGRMAQNLSPGDAKDKSAQQDYIEAYQELLKLQVWDLLMKGASALAQRLYELVNALWTMVGDPPAQGWISLFESNCRKRLQGRVTELISTRSRLAGVKVRRFFPSPNDRAEQAMFDEFVTDGGLIPDLLRDMSWTFESTRPGQLGFSPQQDVASYELILHLPQIKGFDRETYRRGLADVTTGRFRQLILSRHAPEEVVQFGRNRLEGPLSDLSIWEAMHYDYQYEWALRVQEQGGTPSVETYVDELLNDMAQKASTLLSQQVAGGAGGAGVAPFGYCLSAFRDVPGAPVNSIDHLATAFYGRLRALGRDNDDSSISKRIFMINFEHRVPLNNWAYYSTSMGHYFEYLSDPGARPVHVFPEERNAVILERYLIPHGLISGGATVTVPSLGMVTVRCLDISVVRHLGDMEAFRIFTFGYVFELFSRETAAKLGEPDRYYVDIQDATGRRPVVLGVVGNMGEILTRFVAQEAQATRVREEIRQRWDKIVSEKKAKADWRKELAQELREKASGISFPASPSAGQDPIHREDLKLAMQAVLYQLAETVEQ